MQILEGTEGATMPAWSGTGSNVAYLSSGSIWIMPRDGDKPAKVRQLSGGLVQAQLAWAGDSALYFRTPTCLGRVEIPNTAWVKIAEWEPPRAPKLKPDDFKGVGLPQVTVAVVLLLFAAAVAAATRWWERSDHVRREKEQPM